MSADDHVVFPCGAPPEYAAFPVAWGGVSVYVPYAEQGEAALVFVHRHFNTLSPDGTRCFQTADPSISCDDAITKASVVLVHDRCIGIPSQSDSGSAGVPPALVHHLCVTVRSESQRLQLDHIANCLRWDLSRDSALGRPSSLTSPGTGGPGHDDGSAGHFSGNDGSNVNVDEPQVQQSGVLGSVSQGGSVSARKWDRIT